MNGRAGEIPTRVQRIAIRPPAAETSAAPGMNGRAGKYPPYMLRPRGRAAGTWRLSY